MLTWGAIASTLIWEWEKGGPCCFHKYLQRLFLKESVCWQEPRGQSPGQGKDKWWAHKSDTEIWWVLKLKWSAIEWAAPQHQLVQTALPCHKTKRHPTLVISRCRQGILRNNRPLLEIQQNNPKPSLVDGTIFLSWLKKEMLFINKSLTLKLHIGKLITSNQYPSSIN